MVYDMRMYLKGNRSETTFLAAPLTSYCILAKDYLFRNYYPYFDIFEVNIPYVLPSIFGHYVVLINFETFDGYKTYIIDLHTVNFVFLVYVIKIEYIIMICLLLLDILLKIKTLLGHF